MKNIYKLASGIVLICLFLFSGCVQEKQNSKLIAVYGEPGKTDELFELVKLYSKTTGLGYSCITTNTGFCVIGEVYSPEQLKEILRTQYNVQDSV